MNAGQLGNARNKKAGDAGNVSGGFRSGGSAYQNSNVLSMVRAQVAEHKEAYGEFDTIDDYDVAIALTRRVLDLDSDLSPVAQFLLTVLAFHAAEDGTRCFPTIKRLMRQTHFARATVLKGLAELERGEWIGTQRRGHRSAERTINLATILNYSNADAEVYDADPQGLRCGRREVHDVDFSYERPDRKTPETPEDLRSSKRVAILEDSDHDLRTGLSFLRSLSELSSDAGEVSTNAGRPVANPTQKQRFEVTQRERAAEDRQRRARFAGRRTA